MTRSIYTVILSFVFLCSHTLLAQTKSVNVVTTAVPFLYTPADTRAAGMGNTGIATSPDVNAIFYNTGKLPFTKSKGAISMNYSPWLKEWSSDMYLASLAGYYRLSENKVVHTAIRYFNPGGLQFTDNSGNYLQSWRPNEFSVEAGYSMKLSDRIGLGLSIKYIRSNLANGNLNGGNYKAGNAVAADLGFFYDLRNQQEEGFSFGAALKNLGSKIAYTSNKADKAFIPADIGLGTSYTKIFDEQNKLSFALDIHKLLVPTPPGSGDSAALVSYRNKTVISSWFSSFGDAPGGFSEELKECQLSVGAEYWYNNQFSLRAGYFYEDKTKGDRKYFSAGAGASYNMFTIHFSYLAPAYGAVNKSPLSNTMQFGIIISLKN